MEALKLKAEIRKRIGKRAKHLRQEGLVPAVLYGRDLEAKPIQVETKSLDKILEKAGTHQLISLVVDNQRPMMTLARDIQRDVIKRDYVHVDFYAVKMDEKVVARVPLVFAGEAPAVKELGGVLTQGLDELEIECLPTDLISSIEVNIEGLTEFNDTISVSDLTLPGSVAILSDSESMVAKIEPPRKAEEVEALVEGEEAPESAAPAEPEVLTAATDEE